MAIKLYIDDIRDVPDESWTLIRTISEAIRCIVLFRDEITEISLDHDISFDVRIGGVYRPFPSPDTFQPVAYFIGEVYQPPYQNAPKITIHTANPAGAESLQGILEYYQIGYHLNMMGEAFRKK